MAGTTVKIKQSAVLGKVPEALSLVQGELALNTADQKLYSKDSTGYVFEIGGASGASGANEIITTDIIATASQTSFPVLYNVLYDHVNVYYNGLKLAEVDFTATSGTNVLLTAGALVGDIVTIEVIKAINLANGSNVNEYEFIATLGQTTFVVPDGYNKAADDIDVYVNGIKLLASLDYTHTNGTDVVLTDSTVAGDEVVIKHIKIIALANVVNVSGENASAIIPTGTTVQRDVSPDAGYLRLNNTLNVIEFYNGTTWVSLGSEGYTDTKITDLIAAAPAALDTLNELAAALGNDDDFATTVTNALTGKVDDSQVLTDVPAGAVFTDTVYSHPASHTIAEVTGLQGTLDGKVDDAQVLTNVPSGALFTDTIYSHPTNHAISVITGLQTALDGKVDDSQVLTDVPSGAVFTDTVYDSTAIDAAVALNTAKVTNVTTNLSTTTTATTNTVVSSDGTNAVLPAATTTVAGVQTGADKAKLDGIEVGATADQTNAEIKTAYEANANSNEFSDAEQTKLAGIATSANNYTHPANHAISVITGLQTALDGKVDDSQVLTDVPSGAVFTDTETTTTLSIATNILSYVDELGATTNLDLSLYLDDTNLAYIASGALNGSTGIATFTRSDATTFTVDLSALLDDTSVTVNNTLTSTSTTEALSANQGKVLKGLADGLETRVALNDAKVSNVAHPLVETAVPVGAVFTDTVYTHPTQHSISEITNLQTEIDAALGNAVAMAIALG